MAADRRNGAEFKKNLNFEFIKEIVNWLDTVMQNAGCADAKERSFSSKATVVSGMSALLRNGLFLRDSMAEIIDQKP